MSVLNLFYQLIHFIKLYKFHTTQVISLLHFLIPYYTEKNDHFAGTVLNYVNKGQTGRVNIIIVRRTMNFGIKWRILYCILTLYF